MHAHASQHKKNITVQYMCGDSKNNQNKTASGSKDNLI
jgi:hypothetical protein